MTDISSLSLPDTVLLLDQGLSDAFVDHSQHRTNLAELGAGDYFGESSSARTAIDAPREVAVVWDIQSGESGVLVDHGNATNHGYQLGIAVGSVYCSEGGDIRVLVALPGLAAGVDRTFLISWCQHPDGTSVRSELLVVNLTTGAVAHAQATHAAGSTSATDTLTIGAAFGGASKFSASTDFSVVRIGRRFHSQAEQRESFVAETTPPATTMLRRDAPLVPDRATLDIASDGSFAGPAHLWAGHAFEQADRRLVGPLVNLQVHDPLELDHNFETPNTAWWRVAPGDSAVHLCIALLWYRPVPMKVNRAHVRLFVRQRNDLDVVTAEVRWRMYSLANLPLAGEPIKPMTYHRTAQATCSNAHGIGSGEWLDLGELPLALDADRMTWLAVGIEFDETSPHLGDSSVYVHAVTVEPYFEPADDGALDIADA